MEKKNTAIWKLSLLVIVVLSAVWAVCNIAEIKLSGFASGIMVILDIIAIPV